MSELEDINMNEYPELSDMELFELDESDLELLNEAKVDIPYSGSGPKPMTIQQRTNQAWAKIGMASNFNYLTVEMIDNKSFVAEVFADDAEFRKFYGGV